MTNTLKKHIDKLNTEIENKEFHNPDKTTILPLIQSNIQENEFDLEKLLENNCTAIKKLKFFEISDFLIESEKIEKYLSKLTDEIFNILPEDADLQSINYLLYEILINIYKHSRFGNAYIQLDISKNNDNIDICVIDDGIGISGSFKDASLSYINDCESLFEAINGKTSDKEKYKLHGRGLNSCARITTHGFDGEMLIASGKGICVVTTKGAQLYKNKYGINGTFIVLRINNKKIDNIYEYLKYKRINKIQEVKQ